ncbi:hypothetical protein CR513_13848, partial [Mucuna pruriens]
MDIKTTFLNDDCVRMCTWINLIVSKKKNSGNKFIILILYADDILLACTNMNFLLEIKQILTILFYMKDLGNASFVLGIEIHHDRSNGVLGLEELY